MPEIKKMCGAIRYTIEFKVEEAFDFNAVKNNGNLVAQTNSLDEFNMDNRMGGKAQRENNRY